MRKGVFMEGIVVFKINVDGVKDLCNGCISILKHVKDMDDNTFNEFYLHSIHVDEEEIL